MRICHFTSTFFPRIGGVEIVVSNLAEKQHKMGHSVLVLTPKIRGVDNRVDVPYRVVHYGRPSSKRFLTRQVILRLLYEHIRQPFDIVHSHSAYPHGYVAASFSRLTGVPYIVTPHGPTDIMRNEQIRTHPKLAVRMAEGLKSASVITAISRDIEQEILSVGGISDEKVRIIPNGVNLSDFEGVEPAHHEGPYILALGRMVYQKGFDLLIDVFAEVLREAPELHLLLGGEGVMRKEYEARARELGITDRIKFLGLVQGSLKVAYMKGAEFFVCPSRFEPFGIVVLEALASGVPVIANRVGGIVDIVEDGIQGVLVHSDNKKEFAREIVRMHRDKVGRGVMAQAARYRAQMYDWSRINAFYMEAYEDSIRDSKKSGESNPSSSQPRTKTGPALA